MFSSHCYILVLDTEPRGHRDVHPLELQLQYPIYIARSVNQAINRALQIPPSLVILIGDNAQHWPTALVKQLRQNSHTQHLTIVALTNSASPQWSHLEDTPGLDGFLVRPLSNDILHSLVESATARTSRG